MTDVPDVRAYRDWAPVDGDRDNVIMEICRAKGLKLPNPEISNWSETHEGITPFHAGPRALVIRWPGPESSSHVRVIKKGQFHSSHILNPKLENNQSIVVVLGGDEPLLIVGKLHVRQVRSDHRPW
jgi:hypothetical protein